MPVTRINNNQISDASAGNTFVGINAAVKLQNYSITATKIANNLTYGSDLTITGNLTVQGNTTTIDTTYTVIEDPILLLASNQTGAPSVDIGFVGQRGTSNNVAFVWDESADEFVTVYTTTGETNTTINIASYADIHSGNANIGGNAVINGTTSLVGNLIGAVNATGNITGGNLITPGLVTATGTITSSANVTGSNLNTSGQVVATGNITGGNVSTGGLITATGTITSSANVTGANINTAGLISATGNINGGNLNAVNQVRAATGYFTGNVDVLGNLNATVGIVYANSGIFYGDATTGNNAAFAGVPGFTQLASNVVMQFAGNVNSYSQLNFENVNNGTLASTDYVATADNGNDTTFFVDMGIAGSNHADPAFFGDSSSRNDAYLYVVANGVTSGSTARGNLIVGSTNGNIKLFVGNTAQANVIQTISSGGIDVVGRVSATGNVTGGNINTAGLVSATGNVIGGNVSTAGLVTATGNVNTSAGVLATGNITGGNVNTSGQVSAAGNITTAANISGGNISTSGTFTSASLSSSGNITGGNLITGGLITATGNITSTANVAGGNVIATTTVSAPSHIGTIVSVTGNVTGGNVITGGLVSATGNITSAANIAGGNLSVTGAISAATVTSSGNIFVGGNLTVQGNIQYTNVDDLRVEDPVIIMGTGPNGAPLTADDGMDRGIYMEYYKSGAVGNAFVGWNNSTGNMIAATSVNFSANNVVNVLSYGTFQTGNIFAQSSSATGNVTGGNLITSGLITATGNVTSTSNVAGGNVIATTTVSAPSHIGTIVSVSGNVTGGNLITGGLITATGAISTAATLSATGNITGGNISTGGLITATGNITSTANVAGGNVIATTTVTAPSLIGTIVSATGNVTGGNISTGGLITATGNITSTANVAGGNVIATTTVTAPSLIGTIVSATGNVTGGNVITGGLITATGNITSTANVAGGNVIATTTVSAPSHIGTIVSVSGNVTGGNLLTGGLISATANITGGNLVTGGQVSATGNITSAANIAGGNLAITTAITSATLSSSGNVTGGNLITGGLITATGNITSTANVAGGNVIATTTVSAPSHIGTIVSVTGNVTGGNLITGGLITATGNITSAANVVATNLSATGNITGANINTGGSNGLTLNGSNVNSNAGRITINSADADVDFAVDGSGAGNVFYVDAGTRTASFGSSTQTTNAIVAFNATNSILMPVGNTAQRPSAGVTGMLRFNTTLDVVEVYDSDSWTTVGSPSFTVVTDDQFTGNGSQTVYTLANAYTTNSVIVSINGVVQIPTSAYSVSGNALTFTEAPQSGDLIDVRGLTTTTQVVSISNSPGTAVLAPNATLAQTDITGNLIPTSNVTFNLGSATARWKDLFLSGTSMTLGNIVMKNVSGNTVAFYGPDGSTPATIDSTNVDTTTITNGTSNVSVASSGGNVRFNIGGTSNVMVVNATGAAITGDLSVTGNATLSGNILGDRVQNGTTSFDIQTPSGNANVSVSGTSNVAVFAPTGVFVTGAVSATGNITGSFLFGNGSQLTGIDATSIQNGTSNARVVSSGGNVAISVGGTPNVAVFATTGLFVTGVASVSGNITGGNLSVGTGTITVNNIVNGGSNGVGNIGSASTYFNTVFAKATSAQYADLAENYCADAEYAPGTVLSFGGENEVTVSATESDRRIAGVVSTNPSYIMNSTLDCEFVATVALTGRVPTLVSGPVVKGDMMVSAGNGRAMACAAPTIGTVIGKALENHAGGDGVIEVVVGRL